MVRRCVFLLLLLLALPLHAGQFSAKLDRSEGRLGEPVLLQLELRGNDASLDELDLGALALDFEVFSITRSAEARLARLEATLYPLRSGALTITALTVAGNTSKAIHFMAQDDPDLSLQASFTPDKLFERQRSVLLLSIRDKADRQWTAPTRLDVPGLLLRPLGEKQFEQGEGEARVNVRELRWEVLGLKPGHYPLQLPLLDGYQLGRRLRMPLPVAPLEVQALPGYLPVAVPVGKPDVMVDLPAREAQVGRPLLWVLRIAAPGFTPDAARTLLHLPQGEQHGLRFYPASIQTDITEPETPALRIEIPVLPLRSGLARIPTLNLPYFDPRSQRIEQVPIPGIEFDPVNPFWQKLRHIGLFVASLMACGFLLYQGRLRWEAQAARRAARQGIAQAANAGELLHAVCAHARAPQPITLRQWLQRQAWQDQFEQLVEALEQARFGSEPEAADLNALKQSWLAALKGCPLS